jgi:hypothetical protein
MKAADFRLISARIERERERDNRRWRDAQRDPFVCPRCGFVSRNPNDKANRYCGRCHVFVDDPT